MKRLIEQRTVPCDVRDAEENILSGHAALFDVEADIGGMFIEKISPRAFRKTLDESDQVALWNHNSDLVLGRRSAGTLTLEEDERGLPFTISVSPEITAQRDAWLHVQRGDVKGASFGFEVLDEEWDRKTRTRTIKEVRLHEISLTAFPAYTETEATARSILEARGINFESNTLAPDAPDSAPPDDGPDAAEIAHHAEAVRRRLHINLNKSQFGKIERRWTYDNQATA